MLKIYSNQRLSSKRNAQLHYLCLLWHCNWISGA